MTLRELLEKRAKLIADARALLDAAEEEGRELADEERQQYDRMIEDAVRIGEDVERRQRLEDLESRMESSGQEPILPEPGEPRSAPPNGRESEEYRTAYESYLRGGPTALLPDEVRALQVDNEELGGYLVTPMQFVRDMIQAVDDAVYIRQWATSFQVPSADSLGVPTLESDPADADWTTELDTGSEDSSMAFGRRALHPHPLAKRIKVSRKLLRMVPSAEDLVRDRLAYKFAITWEQAALTGDGAQQPLGVFTASDEGISTSRDVSTGNTDTSIKFDGLIEAKYALKQQYWPRARWMFHRAGGKQIAKLKDGEGQYIWRESVRVGEPDRLLGLPTFLSEYVPSTFTSGNYVGILGDFSNYWIADALDMEIQRLVELYAETNQVGMIGRLESDGMPVLEEAFARVKLT